MASDSRAIRFATADGFELEGDVHVPEGATVGVVIAHPHPQFGGNRHNNVVGSLFEALAAAGVAVLRFDFRGVGRSEGTFDEGVGERTDVVAALDALAGASTDGPQSALALAGYSFGADTCLSVDDARPVSFLAVAPPLQIGGAETFSARSDERPVRIIAGTNDQFRPADAAALVVQAWPNTSVTKVAGADHFFANHTDEVARLATQWANTLAP